MTDESKNVRREGRKEKEEQREKKKNRRLGIEETGKDEEVKVKEEI